MNPHEPREPDLQPTQVMPPSAQADEVTRVATGPLPDAPTRLLDAAPVDGPLSDASHSQTVVMAAESGTSVSSATVVSAPLAGSPATMVSVPLAASPPLAQTQVSAAAATHRRTGASATPSSARTASSAAGRSELPDVGELVKDRFELIEELGRGGMGAVFRARDLRKVEALDPDPYVAIKFISGGLIGFERAFIALQREAKNAQALNHPNIVKVFDFDRDGSRVFLTMEVVDGEPLNKRLRALPERPLSTKERHHLVRGMLAGMSYAHQRELSHADLKPSNMMIDANGDLRILDFGIARRREYDTVFDADDLFALTVDYASVEMLAQKRPVPADDVYALGCIVHALHTGRHPFEHQRADEALKSGLKPQRPPTTTRVQWQALRKALAFRRDERFVDAEQFLRAYEGRDWRKIGGVAGIAAALLLTVAWVMADPLQSWLTVSRLAPEQRATLDRGLRDGEEYLAGGYAEDALIGFSEALGLDAHNARARRGITDAFGKLRSTMEPARYRDFLQAQAGEVSNPAWLRELATRELAAAR